MSRRKHGRDVHGVILLDKPAGISSNRALQKVRKLFEARKAGHTGSLDPFATGMLPVCLGEASKTAAFLLDAEKEYLATARFGVATSTGDPEGEVVARLAVPGNTVLEMQACMEQFLGEILQIPPMYSALKHKGQPLYKLARKGVEVERKSRTVNIHLLELLEWAPPDLVFRVRCSKGTYIRTLAEDIAGAMGSCAHLQALRRVQVARFDSGRMVTLESLESAAASDTLEDCLLPVDAGLEDWPIVELEAGAATNFCHGGQSVVEESRPGMVRVYGAGAALLGLGEVTAEGRLRPRRVFNMAPSADAVGGVHPVVPKQSEVPEK